MKTNVNIRSETKSLRFGWWDEEIEKFIPIESQSDYGAAATALGCSKKLLDTLSVLMDSIKESVDKDLCDIWKRMDAAGI